MTHPAFLMCRPDHFVIDAEINPWMDRRNQPDRAQAWSEWTGLARTLQHLEAGVEVIEPVVGLPDMVFATDSGLVVDGSYLASSFRHPSRRGETARFASWFRAQGYHVVELALPPGAYFEGGDVRRFAGQLVIGCGFRTTEGSLAHIGRVLGLDVHPVRLVDPRFYHLDICFCPLDDRHALIVPEALEADSYRRLRELVPEPIEIQLDEASSFCANAIVINRAVVMHSCPPRLEAILRSLDFRVLTCPVPQFRKSGGAVNCMALRLA
jgi:N-dimethylarginine dimethylaminohydrolase